MRAFLSALCVLLAVAPAPAQDSPEPTKHDRAPAELLPARSLFYFHFDGIGPHRKGFDKTVLAKILKEDLGDFFRSIGKSIEATVAKDDAAEDAPAPAAIEEGEGVIIEEPVPAADKSPAPPPKKHQMKKITKAQQYKNVMHLLNHLMTQGVVVSADVSDAKDYQVTCVIPNAARKMHWEPLHRSLKQCVQDGHGVKVHNERGRTIYQVKETTRVTARTCNKLPLAPDAPPALTAFLAATPPLKPSKIYLEKQAVPAARPVVTTSTVYLAWWKEGDHVVLTVGNRPVGDALEVIDGIKPNLTSNPLYKKVAAFNQYENYCRGFVDIKPVVELVVNTSENQDALARGMEAMFKKLVVGQLGLSDVQSLTWHCGFEGKYQRSTIKLNVAQPEQRHGLLKLVSAPVKFSTQDLPPLPSDADWVSVHHVDWQRVYDTFAQLYQTVQMGEWISSGGPLAGKMPSVDRQLQEAIGLNLREELLGALDTTVVLSSAWSEGPWLLGNTFAVKVKDAQKLQATLDKLLGLLNKVSDKGSDEKDFFQLKQTKYLGATINTLRMKIDPIGISPSYIVQDGWFIVGVFPQNVKSFVWRSKNPTAAWKIPAIADKAILAGLQSGNAKTKLAAVTVTDPRRSAELFLPFVAIGAQLTTAELDFKTTGFDMTTLPPTKAVTSRLAPNVTAFFDDGDAWRWETWATVTVPSVTELTVLYCLLGGAASLSSGDITLPFAQTRVPETGITLPPPMYLPHAPAMLPDTPPEPGHVHEVLPEPQLPVGDLIRPKMLSPVPASPTAAGLPGRLGMVPIIPTGATFGMDASNNEWQRQLKALAPAQLAPFGASMSGSTGSGGPVSGPPPLIPPER